MGTLIRTTLYQMGALKDAVERQTRSQRGWFDSALLQRKRNDVLATLGEVVYELALAGELEGLDDFPEISQALADLQDIDERIAEVETELAGRRPVAHGGRPGARDDAPRDEEVRVWRPVMPPDDEEGTAAPEQHARPASKPRRRRARKRAARGGGGITFVEDEVTQDAVDEDLSEYMHDDDVPPSEADAETSDD